METGCKSCPQTRTHSYTLYFLPCYNHLTCFNFVVNLSLIIFHHLVMIIAGIPNCIFVFQISILCVAISLRLYRSSWFYNTYIIIHDSAVASNFFSSPIMCRAFHKHLSLIIQYRSCVVDKYKSSRICSVLWS